MKQQLQPPELLNHDNDSHAVPFEAILEAVMAMPYASPLRVMFEMLAITGCRMSELDLMRWSQIYDGVLYWHLGKNQRTFRKERLPSWLVREISEYHKTHRVYKDRLFGLSNVTFRRMFNRDVRPRLSRRWQEIRLFGCNGTLQAEYVLQLKGLRKTYQTIEFARQYAKWHDASVALEFTSKKMRHSSVKITAHHYVENFDELGISAFGEMRAADLLPNAHQARILDYFVE